MFAIAGPSNVAACRRQTLQMGATMARKYANASDSRSTLRPALDIDPSFQEIFPTLTPDFKQKSHKHPKPPVELHVYEPSTESFKSPSMSLEPVESNDHHEAERREERRSPAAVFGSQRVGHVVLSDELDRAVAKLIAGGDKHQLRSDAKRLFLHPTPASAKSSKWGTTLPTHKSKSKDRQMAPRDGLAFLAVAMPAHYAVITRVLNEAKHRLEPGWNIEQVVDFGAKTGTGLWACKDALGGIKHYVGIDSRTGITRLAEDLNKVAEHESPTKVAFLKQWGKDERGLRSSPDKSLALCAFTLSELKTDLDRKMMLRELWNSGAETIVIIDHGTKEGFQYVGSAREYLLKRGRRELSQEIMPDEATQQITRQLGSHVVAPCPHDGVCPLHAALQSIGEKKPTRLMKSVAQMGPTPFCHFTQRLHRPEFVRLTKHSHQSHEDILYSYVVIRRGPRPSVDPHYTSSSADKGIGHALDSGWARNRSGAVAREAQRALELKQRMQEGGANVVVENEDGELHFIGADAEPAQLQEPLTPEEQLKDAEGLRNEAFSWPRVIYPPMKRSGHVVLDSCTPDGNISRITIPKSQGKQPYLDARKSSWGDIFPHPPKNGPEVRKRGQPPAAPTDTTVEDVDDDKELAELLSRLQSKDGTYEFMV